MLLAIDPGEKTGVAIFREGILVHAGTYSGDRPTTWAGITSIIAERPQVYDRKVDANNLITLAIRLGRWLGAYPTIVPVLVRPPEWKGQLPKAVSHRRIWARLTASEAAQWDSLGPDARDAVGIGLAGLGR